MQLTHRDPLFPHPHLPHPLSSIPLRSIEPFSLLPLAPSLRLAVVGNGGRSSSSEDGFRLLGENGGGVGEDFDDPFVPDFPVVGLAPHVDDEF